MMIIMMMMMMMMMYTIVQVRVYDYPSCVLLTALASLYGRVYALRSEDTVMIMIMIRAVSSCLQFPR